MKEIKLLPLDEFKAFRRIWFTYPSVNGNITAVLGYFRPAPFEKMQQNEKGDFDLPLDDVDNLLLDFVNAIDPNAALTSRSVLFDVEQEGIDRLYNGIPTENVEILYMPEIRTLDFLALEGQLFTQYSRQLPIKLYGRLHEFDPHCFTAHYDAMKKESVNSIMEKLDDRASGVTYLK